MLLLILESTTSHAQISHLTDVTVSFVSSADGEGRGGGESHFESAMRGPTALCMLPTYGINYLQDIFSW